MDKYDKKLSRPRFLLQQTLSNLKKWGRRLPKTRLETATKNSVTFVGHATMIYNLDGVRIITDPMLYNQIKHIRKNTPIARETISRKYDLILLTHMHMDHFHYPSLKLLDRLAQVVAPVGTKRKLHSLGFKKVIELRPKQTIELLGLKITTLECNHDGRRMYSGPQRDTLSYLIESSRYKIFSCGDTAFTHKFDNIICDIAFMPVGCYTPAQLQDRHCSPEQSFKMFQAMNAKKFIPIHFGTLQLALDNEEQTMKRILDLQSVNSSIKILKIGKNYPLKSILSSDPYNDKN